MAEDEQSQEKTEEPTEKKLEDSRNEGQIARSQEIGSLVTMIGAGGLLFVFGSQLLINISKSLKGAFEIIGYNSPSNLVIIWMQLYAWPTLKLVLFFAFGIFLMVAFSQFLQTGVVFAWKSLAPKPEKINPMTGLKNLFSSRVFLNLGKNIAKISVIGLIVYFHIQDHLKEMLGISNLSLFEAFKWSGNHFFVILIKVCIFLAIVAVVDYIYEWFTLRKKLMMSRQDLKDELKNQQLPDHVRAKVRQVANERAKREIQKEVPQADVIVTNPTHFAVAIRYKRFEDQAPRVVAKGKDFLALTIRELAKENNVPLYEYPQLARKLYRKVKIGGFIPYELYEAVAKVLAFVYQLHRRETGIQPPHN